nr:DUF4375 domain-containing protein [Celeribacter sp. HF31]
MQENAKYYDAWSSLHDYTQAAIHSAGFLAGEFPIEASWLFAADYYIGEAMNGGHSRYLGNLSNLMGNNDHMIPYALKGLQLIGCTQYRDILQGVLRWQRDFPEDAASQNGFTQRAQALDKFDESFFALDDETYYLAVREWLKTSPLVEFLSEEECRERRKNLYRQNPNFELRKRAKIIEAQDDLLTQGIISIFRASVAGFYVNEETFLIESISQARDKKNPFFNSKGGDFTDPANMVWKLKTEVGQFFGFVTSDEVVICDDVSKNGVYHSIFRRSLKEVAELQKRAAQQKPTRYAYELLKQVAPSESIAYLSFLTDEDFPEEISKSCMFYFIRCQSGALYLMMVNDKIVNLYSRETIETVEAIASLKGKALDTLRAQDFSKLM